MILELVRQQEERFVKFYNEAQAISTRYHMLELLPGLGKKTMWAITEERKKSLFETFEDLETRVTSLHKPLINNLSWKLPKNYFIRKKWRIQCVCWAYPLRT